MAVSDSQSSKCCLINSENYGRLFCACLVLIGAITFTIYSPNEYFSPEDGSVFNFVSEWYDPISGMVWKLKISFYSKDNSVEMYDIKNQKIFLKRIHILGVEEKDFYVGNTVVILSRHLKIVDYADDFTQQEISRRRQRTFAMIKPDAVHRVGEIVEFIQSRGFEVTQMKMVRLSKEHAQHFYEEHSGRTFFGELVAYITSGPVIAIELVGDESVVNWRKNLGPTDSQVARVEAPDSLRARYGTDKQLNAAHGSDSTAAAKRELSFFFGDGEGKAREIVKATAHFQNNTCCIIKPHAVSAGNLGKILSAITQEGFKVTALQMFRLEKNQAEEFLEVYKEVLPEQPRMVQQLISGPLVALEVSGGEDASTHEAFRTFVGPMDPEVAKELRPSSLRARFGRDKVRNGVHCSDLPEDAPAEVEFFFDILQ